MDLYIYYRVRNENAAVLYGRATAMQQRLATEYGIAGMLKRRPEEKDGCQTWMEIYPAAPAGFEAAVDQAVTRDGLAPLIDGPRHTEHFVDIPTCA